MDKLKQHIQSNRGELDTDLPKPEMWNRIKQELTPAVDVDSLKNHIAQNANDLEIDVPPSDTWSSIQHTIHAKRTARVVRIRKAFAYCAAACILALLCVGALLSVNHSAKDSNSGTVKIRSNVSDPAVAYALPETKQPEEITPQRTKRSKQALVQSTVKVAPHETAKEKQPSLSQQFLKVENGYDELITSQVKYTQSLALYGESPSYFEGFINDFKALDEHEKQLRKSIMLKGMQDEGINELAMIYQQKLTVLKKLQIEINKISNRNKGITDTLPAYIRL